MILSIVAVALVLAITFYQSMFGLFSGLINLFCTIMAAAVSFGCFQQVTRLLVEQGVHPAYSEPASFVGLFLVTLLLLRTVTDLYIRGNVHVPMYVDWGGGAVCGFFNAQITVGVVMLGFLMLPWDPAPLGFAREYRTEYKTDDGYTEFDSATLSFLRPDEFTAGLFQQLAGGSLAPGAPEYTFKEVYPDFVEWVFWSRNTVQAESSPVPYVDEGDGFAKGVEVVDVWTPTLPIRAEYVERPRERDSQDYKSVTKEYRPPTGRKMLAYRLRLNPSAADRANDRVAMHLFRPTMLRLVGQRNGRPAHYIPRILAGADAEIRGAARIVEIDNNFSLTIDNAGNFVDAYFEVPESFTPEFVEYRGHARAAVAGRELAEAPPESLPPLLSESDRDRIRRMERDGFIGAVDRRTSGRRKETPIKLDRAALSRADVTLVDGEFAAGRIAGPVAALEAAGRGSAVEDFFVPGDDAMFKLHFRPYEAQSIAGDVFNFVGRTLNQYHARDEEGKEYPLVGYYGIVERDGEDFIEVFYVGGAPDSPQAIGYRQMLDFKEIDGRELNSSRSNARLGLLFIVPAEVRIESVHTQTGAGVEGLRRL